ncbi:MAG: hypothetical protein ACI4OY_04120 [Aristaeellaceae bacterium]
MQRHTAVVNERDRIISSSGFGSGTTGAGATVDVTVLIFEWCIKPAEF